MRAEDIAGPVAAQLRCGVIGLGMMGEPMAGRIAESQHACTVFDIRPEPVDRIVARGATAAGSLAELARASDIIMISVVSESQVSDVMIGEDHGSCVLPNARPGTIVVIHSTVHPDACAELGARAAAYGVRVLDAPITGGPAGAATGTLTIMVGGDSDTFTRCRPILDLLGKLVVHVGGLGQGQVAKVANNVALAACVQGVFEALELARHAGIPDDVILPVLASGGAQSWAVDNWPGISATFDTYSRLISKDLGIAASLAEADGFELPAARVIGQAVAARGRYAQREP